MHVSDEFLLVEHDPVTPWFLPSDRVHLIICKRLQPTDDPDAMAMHPTYSEFAKEPEHSSGHWHQRVQEGGNIGVTHRKHRLMMFAASWRFPGSVDIEDAGDMAEVERIVVIACLCQRNNFVSSEFDDEVADLQAGCAVRQRE